MSEPTAADLLHSLEVAPPVVDTGEAERIAAEVFGVHATASPLGGERDRNFRLSNDAGELLLKVANDAEPDTLLDFQSKALRHIERQDPSLPVPRVLSGPDGADWSTARCESGAYRVRLLSYVAGIPLSEAPDDARLMRGLGEFTARMDRALQGFFHAGADHPLAWDLKHATRLRHLAGEISDPRRREMVERVFERFESTVVPSLGGLRAQVIHNDVSFHNTSVPADAPWTVSGVFDFGDLIHAPLVQELAVPAAEVPAGRADPVATSAAFVAGYHAVTPLAPEELALLPYLATGRLALSCVINAWRQSLDLAETPVDWGAHSADVLEALEPSGPGALERAYRAACGIAPAPASAGSVRPSTYDLRERRERRLGKGLHLSYDQPLHTVRGEGVWLYDAEGHAYLDCYNNVPQVGHCHLRVVEAIARQAATLNTNTRYLYESIVEYTERLTATLPEGLEICMLVASGSEANDLAWRIAKACTGNSGAMVMEDAYHGVTDAVTDLSPSRIYDPEKLAPHVTTVPPPDGYRGEWRRDDPDCGERYASLAEASIERLAAKGHAPAAFFIDTILASNGIIAPPSGYLTGVFERVRAAGGLCVADEVQAGFGRTGDGMWGFELDAVVPDIVTFGKPIGNGHPIGAVVMRSEIAEAFATTTHFFSTTGGNPVSCAAGLAVLGVIEREGLQENARTIGAELERALEDLALRRPMIGDVRGAGLFVGVELVRDRETREPAGPETSAVVNHLRAHGVLIGIEGRYSNVLKIRPPIVFRSSHVARLVEALDQALESVG